MSHFAEIDDAGIVLRVIVADQTFIKSMPGTWLQTSYNTHGGIHVGGGVPLRMNYAGIGYTYDKERDAFIEPQPFKSWVLDEKSCLWFAPVEMPADGKSYEWGEATQTWLEVKRA